VSTEDARGKRKTPSLGAGGYISLALSGLGVLAFWDAEATKRVHGEELFALIAFAIPLVLWALALLAGLINLLVRRRFRNPVAWLPVLLPCPFLAGLVNRLYF
jgi:hypothetical protein